MTCVAKVFYNGRSQAVRLPSLFRFSSKEVFIRKDEKTGDVILSPKSASWEEYFQLLDKLDIPKNFMDDRTNEPPQEREELF
jgi:antitoxin VapB